MTRMRKASVAYLVALGVERAMAYSLVQVDAAGQLLSAGIHTPIHVGIAIAFFVVLRFVVWGALPFAIVWMLVDLTAHRWRTRPE